MRDFNNFQRLGSTSNAQVGADFELIAKEFFEKDGLVLTPNHRVLVGVDGRTKERRFDLGSERPAILIECKSHTWTSTGNIPSAKLAVWNEAMLYFHVTPLHYRKILFALKSMRGVESLATYYVRCNAHLIPRGVEIWEFDPDLGFANRLQW